MTVSYAWLGFNSIQHFFSLSESMHQVGRGAGEAQKVKVVKLYGFHS